MREHREGEFKRSATIASRGSCLFDAFLSETHAIFRLSFVTSSSTEISVDPILILSSGESGLGEKMKEENEECKSVGSRSFEEDELDRSTPSLHRVSSTDIRGPGDVPRRSPLLLKEEGRRSDDGEGERRDAISQDDRDVRLAQSNVG